jgi:hypothetical protein
MQTIRTCCAVVAPALLLTIACGAPPAPPPVGPAATFSLPTGPAETDTAAGPPVTIPPGFVFPVSGSLNAGNAEEHSWKALFDRTGSLCFTHVDAEPAGEIDRDGQAANLVGDEGLLEGGSAYVGPLPNALTALDLAPTGIVAGDVAYGIGPVTRERARPQLPEGSIWAPRLERFHLADGRTGWAMTGDWTAVIDRDCGVLPTTPG